MEKKNLNKAVTGIKAKYGKKTVILAILFFSAVCFFPRKAALPDYEEAAVTVLKRGPGGDISMELTEQEKTELYAILGNIKGIYLPKLFAEYTSLGRTSYEISIDSEKTDNVHDFRFYILIGLKGQAEHASFRDITENSCRSIINADDLADFLKEL